MTTDPELVEQRVDSQLLRWTLVDGEARRETLVEITGSALCTAPETCPSPQDDVLRTKGGSLIAARLDDPPRFISVNSRWHTVDPPESG